MIISYHKQYYSSNFFLGKAFLLIGDAPLLKIGQKFKGLMLACFLLCISVFLLYLNEFSCFKKIITHDEKTFWLLCLMNFFHLEQISYLRCFLKLVQRSKESFVGAYFNFFILKLSNFCLFILQSNLFQNFNAILFFCQVQVFSADLFFAVRN